MDEWLVLPENTKNWVTLVLGLNFLLFVFIKVRFEQQFFSFIRLIDTPMYFNIYGGKTFTTQGFVYLSGVFFLSNSSLFISFLIRPHTTMPPLRVFLLLFLSIGAILVFRQLFLGFMGYLLDLKTSINHYQFRNLTYLFRLSILLFIGIIFYCYHFAHSEVFLEGLLIMIAGLYCLTQGMVIYQLISKLNQGGLYFILYLCVLKISPWALLIMGLKQIL